MCDYLKIPDHFCQVIGNPTRQTSLWRDFFEFVEAMPEISAVGRRESGHSFEYVLFFEGIEWTEISRRVKEWETSKGIVRGPGGYIKDV